MSKSKEHLKYRDVPLSNLHIDEGVKQLADRQKFNDGNLKPDTNIETIFNNRGHAVIFHKYPNQQVGHWYAVLRTPNKEVFFIDSFGKQPQFYNKNWLACLKNNGYKQLTVNTKKYQHEESAVCGRYALYFCTAHKLKLPFKKMIELLNKGGKEHKSYDNFILYITT